MVEPIQQMEEEVESIVEKHQLEEMERVSVAPKDTEEDDIEPELQRIKVKALLLQSTGCLSCTETWVSQRCLVSKLLEKFLSWTPCTYAKLELLTDLSSTQQTL